MTKKAKREAISAVHIAKLEFVVEIGVLTTKETIALIGLMAEKRDTAQSSSTRSQIRVGNFAEIPAVRGQTGESQLPLGQR